MGDGKKSKEPEVKATVKVVEIAGIPVTVPAPKAEKQAPKPKGKAKKAKKKAKKPPTKRKPKPGTKCSKSRCKAFRGLSRYAKGWRCGAHHPNKKAAHKAGAKLGGKNSRGDGEELLVLKMEHSRKSVIDNLIDQYNFLGNGISKKEVKKHQMLVNISDRIHEFVEEDLTGSEREEKIADLMASKLPDQIKLNKLVDLVGPDEAMEMIPVEVERDPFDHPDVLDGREMLANEGKDGKGGTITKLETLAVEESDSTEDIPDISPIGDGDPRLPDPILAADEKASTSPEAVKPASPPEPPEEKEARQRREAKQLMELYIVKVSGRFKSNQEIGEIFHDALKNKGLSYQRLNKKAMFPRSSTHQAEAMVTEVEKETKEADEAERAKTA